MAQWAQMNELFAVDAQASQEGLGQIAIISIVETCRRLSIRVRDYLGAVLPGLADFPINRVAELTDGPGVCAGTAPSADHLPGLAVNLRPLGHSAPVGRAALPGLLRVDAGPARW